MPFDMTYRTIKLGYNEQDYDLSAKFFDIGDINSTVLNCIDLRYYMGVSTSYFRKHKNYNNITVIVITIIVITVIVKTKFQSKNTKIRSRFNFKPNI